jgi:hypothetical protein
LEHGPHLAHDTFCFGENADILPIININGLYPNLNRFKG